MHHVRSSLRESKIAVRLGAEAKPGELGGVTCVRRSRHRLRRRSCLHLPHFSPGCGTGPSEESTRVATVTSEVDLPTENARIQEFIDSRYAAADVTSSFHTKFGEAIDCIDFYAQPSVKTRLARGLPVPKPSSTKPTGAAALGALADVAFLGQPDLDGRPRACPDGTVPKMRVTPDDILAAGGLDAFSQARRSKNAPPPPDAALPASLT